MLPKNAAPLTLKQREAVIAEAHTWVLTPYHHMADIKKVGVDCGMLLIRVYSNCGIAPFFDPRPYAAQWFLHQDEERYLKWIKQYCVQVTDAEPGDIALYRFGRCAAHGAIVVDDRLMIHAYQPDGQVSLAERHINPYMVDHLDSYWSPRNVA